ncbi:MAG: hypothetical protein KF833_10110 [Verrucomicrobiae bacterium]|nr:hypothetical protein [Verrucomicrobiae bacterium]
MNRPNRPLRPIFSGPGPGRACRGAGRAVLVLLGGALMLAPGVALGAADPYRGLWVGQVTLGYVNEVPVPLDENNVPVAPDPNVATPTSDQAHLRLILHVNAAGQVHLLKDVAVLVREGGGARNGTQPVNLQRNPDVLTYRGSMLTRESDLALVTDERLYPEFPPQPAMRLGSAAYDFGDGYATEAVHAVIEATAGSVVDAVLAGGDEAAARTAGVTASAPVADRADVAAAFGQFLSTHLTRSAVNVLAGPDPAASAAAAALRVHAETLRDRSFYGDSRGVAMLDAIVAAVAAAGADGATRTNSAQNVAASFADLKGEYPRFLAGKVFGDMIAGAAQAAGTAAVAPAATVASLRTAIQGNLLVRAARDRALELDTLSAYADTRARGAVEVVLAAVEASAAGGLPAEPGMAGAIALAAEQAGRSALSADVGRYRSPSEAPTLDYGTFVGSSVFRNSPAVAAEAAARAVILKRAEDPLLSADLLRRVAVDAATDALRASGTDALGAAARAMRRELPMADRGNGWVGGFGSGLGDARLTHAIQQDNQAPLGAPALTGTAFLPATHPTNPFRHFRHPDHRVGFDITRRIRLDFDEGPADGLERAGFGVDRITGVYREEIFGLHKPLGPDRDIGLKVEGRFELNRIALIDALNAR